MDLYGRYCVVDVETTTRSNYRRKGNPFEPENFIVACGWKKRHDEQNQYWYSRTPVARAFGIDLSDVDVLVGFNFKYDLLYSWRDPTLQEFFRRGGRIWCCQLAEYLLMAQRESAHMAALNDVAPKYGGTTKIDAVAELWKQGVHTQDIHEDLLLEYLIGKDRHGGDIGNTERVYLGQVAAAQKLGMYEALKLRMDALCCTTEMEYNGIKIDVETARSQLRALMKERAEVQTRLNTQLPADLPPEIDFKWSSQWNLSPLLYGGGIKYRRRGPILDDAGNPVRKKDKALAYSVRGEWVIADTPPDGCDKFVSGKKRGEPKTKWIEVPGEVKMKWHEHVYVFPGIVTPDESWKTSQNSADGRPLYSCGKDNLITLETKYKVPFCKDLARAAALDKEIGTYYAVKDESGVWSGMLTCVMKDHFIHHKLNHTSTVTSRLSSSDPNLQNAPRKDKSQVKRMFTSRFGSDGVMIEADYSQLEVVGQAFLSRDPRLVEDVNKGVDFHCKRVSMRFKILYEEALKLCKDEDGPDFALWKKRRTEAKIFSFQRAYGAGAQKISDTTGIPKEEIEEMIRLEEEEYSGIVTFNKSVERSVERTAQTFFDPVRQRRYRRGYWQAPTGCLYSFRTYDAPHYLKRQGIDDSWMPTEMKNYPVQGTSGEFVQIVLGKLWRHFVANDNYGGKAFLCNTVHDCVWFDTHKSITDLVARETKEIMESIPKYLKMHFNIDCPVGFPVEVETGPNMYDLHHWKPSTHVQ